MLMLKPLPTPGLRALLAAGLLTGTALAATAQTNNTNPILPVGANNSYTSQYGDPDMQYFGGNYRIYPSALAATPKQFFVFSSPDMLNFTPSATPVFDLGPNCSWESANAQGTAPSLVLANGTYYLYFAADGKIGVATSTSPTGPFTDSGAPLIAADANAPVLGDPAVFVDPDGTPYLFYGGGGRLVVRQLAANMTSFVGNSQNITPSNYGDAPSVVKRANTYYLTYGSGDRTQGTYNTQYATSNSVLGPWTFRHQLIYNNEHSGPGSGSIFKMPGCDEYYFTYQRFDNNVLNHRGVCLDHLTFEGDGTIQILAMTNYSVDARPLATVCNEGTLLSGAVYRISSKAAPARRLEIENNSSANGARIQLANNNDTDTRQRWMVTQDVGGSYRLNHAGIANRASLTGAAGALATQSANAAIDAQRFVMEAVDGGYFKIRLRNTQQVLEAAGTTPGSDVRLAPEAGTDAQRWKLDVQSVGIMSGGTYKITHKGTNQCLEVPVNSNDRGTQISQYFDNGNDAQRWVITLDATTNSYKLTHKGALDPTSNLPQCLEVPSNSNASPVRLQQYDDNGSAAQRWLITNTDLIYSKLIHYGTSNPQKVADVDYGSTNPGTWVQQRDDNADGVDAQRWTFQLQYDARLTLPTKAAAALAAGLELYPNPAQRQLSVHYTPAQSGSFALEVLDVQGRRVAQLPGRAGTQGLTQQQTLDVSALAAGVYTVRLTGPATVATRKLVVVQ
jgi:hypothetical protein